MLPDIPALGNLRHRWVWERRPRPHVPVWSFARIPRSNISPAENARLLSVYMRPWTLDPVQATRVVPLLSKLSTVYIAKAATHSSAAGQVSSSDSAAACQTSSSDGAAKTGDHGSAPGQMGSPDGAEVGRRKSSSEAAAGVHSPTPAGNAKRRRLFQKTPDTTTPMQSYVLAWQHYIDGNVVSETGRLYINNIMGATAARVTPVEGESSSSSEESDLERYKTHAGSMDLVYQTLSGFATRDRDEGHIGFGRHAACIQMGCAMWQTPDLSATEKSRAAERYFDDGTFPDTKDSLAAAAAAVKLDTQRPVPFADRTQPFAHLSTREYGERMNIWLDRVATEATPPTPEQLQVLRRVAARVLQEFRDEKVGEAIQQSAQDTVDDEAQEPLRGLVHGLPGTGKSRVIAWLRSLFEDALGWTHGVEFMCVAFQNRMAAAIGGTTLHTGAGLPRPGENRDHALGHADIDNMYIQNACLRWIILDEVSMVSDHLLGEFDSHITDASRQTRYSKRKDKSVRMFGGYNVVLFGDWWQLPPIPDSGALFLPPSTSAEKQPFERAARARDMFWRAGHDSINYLAELTEQMRQDDVWLLEAQLFSAPACVFQHMHCDRARARADSPGLDGTATRQPHTAPLHRVMWCISKWPDHLCAGIHRSRTYEAIDSARRPPSSH